MPTKIQNIINMTKYSSCFVRKSVFCLYQCFVRKKYANPPISVCNKLIIRSLSLG